ncbi:MAG: hypothetical protein WC661_02150 [Opitutaceae bacterium]|jgi:hypothetical protein
MPHLANRLVVLLFVIAVFPVHVPAQNQAPGKIPPTRELVAVSITDDLVPELFYQTVKNDYAPFIVGQNTAGAPQKIGVGPALPLFRQIKSPKGDTTYTPVAQLNLPSGKPDSKWLLAIYLDPTGNPTYRAFEQPSSNTPAGSVRFINLSSQEVAYKLNETITKLSSGEARMAPALFTANETFTLAYGVQRSDGRIDRSTTKQLFLPSEDMRLLVLFATRRERLTQSSGSAFTLVVRDARIYEHVPIVTPTALQVTQR